MTRSARLAALFLLAPLTLAAQRYVKVHPLLPKEGVFAYSRISPDGGKLVYASEGTTKGVPRMITLVDLATHKVLYTEPGIDAYFSPDGERMIYAGTGGVTIRHLDGRIVRDVAPMQLGDYFSWGARDGRQLILTINSNYYYLDGDRSVLPHRTLPPCPGIGPGDRPLLSKDGMRITTFVRGTIVVRNLTDCRDVFDTGIQGAKADFSFDGRYVAFHAPKARGDGFAIVVVDLQQRTVRTLQPMTGSSYFPSWTADGRLSFRYDGPEYRGFLMADSVLAAPAKPIGTTPNHVPTGRTWEALFPETPRPEGQFAMVMVWGPWSAHAPEALGDLRAAEREFLRDKRSVAVYVANDPASRAADIERLTTRYGAGLRRIPLAPARFPLTEGHNQNPTTLLFRDGRLIDRRMGAQTTAQLRAWLTDAAKAAGAL